MYSHHQIRNRRFGTSYEDIKMKMTRSGGSVEGSSKLLFAMKCVLFVVNVANFEKFTVMVKYLVDANVLRMKMKMMRSGESDPGSPHPSA